MSDILTLPIMTIEKRIKQKKFKSNAEKAIVNIAYTQSYFSSKINSVLKHITYLVSNLMYSESSKGNTPTPSQWEI